MGEIRRIKRGVSLDLSEEARRATNPRPFIALDESHDTEAIREDVDLAALDALVLEMLTDFEPFDTAMDAAFTTRLHRALPLTRREAAERGLWAWLGLIRYPDFVAHRWRLGRDGLRSVERFSGDRVRQTFSRLWWAAELTVGEDGGYALTERLLGLQGFQDVYEAIFGRAFCGHRPALEKFVELFGALPERSVRTAAKELGYLFTTLLVESTNEVHLAEAYGEIIDALQP